jgi:mannitol/fructose-specific phosphotransferase system IIA component
MHEYQTNVSFDGKFLFKTEWDSHQERAHRAAAALKQSMIADPRYTVALLKRNKLVKTIDIEPY